MEAADDPTRVVEFLTNAYQHMLERGGDKLAAGLRLARRARLAAGRVPLRRRQGSHRPARRHPPVGARRGRRAGGRRLRAERRRASPRTRAWADANKPELLAEWMDSIPAPLQGAHPDAMRGVLERFDEEHGGARGFVARFGVSDDVWDERLADAPPWPDAALTNCR